VEIIIKNNVLTLLPQKAIFWQKEKTLVISDLHLGKISHFRREGIAVPQQALQNNFARLDEIMLAQNPSRVIFTGDLFHSVLNDEWMQFSAWRKKYHAVEMHLVMGNHDKLSAGHYEKLPLHMHQTELLMEPFLFSHHPKKNFSENEYVISGHIHPVFKLRGIASQRLVFPCFYFAKEQAVMPSFGYFTGGFEIDPEDGSRVIIVVKGNLKEVFFTDN
jgi:DNA ligase-associated metallophosphoesterase